MSGAEETLVRALRQRKHRVEHRAFLVQGRKLVTEVLAAGRLPRFILATEEAAAVIAAPAQLVRVLPAHRLERLGTFEQGNEVIAVLDMPAPAPPPPLAADELRLALDGVSDPGNLGTILRIADWFGIGHVLLGEGSVDPWNPKCVQASMGSILRVAVHAVDLPGSLRVAVAEGVAVHLAEAEGETVFDADLRRPAILVLGSESHGLSPSVRVPGSRSLAVPGRGGAESLNVAVAAAALCTEFERRRRQSV